MKGSRAIFALAAILLVLCASTLQAQDQYAMPINKTISPGHITVKFDKYVYTILSDTYLDVKFAKLDPVRVKLDVKQLSQVKPFESISVQWGAFPPQELNLTGGTNGDSFILNTETGYAEK
jgi:hypothetical protein